MTIYLMTAGCFLGSINQTILGPALPSIMADLSIDASTAQWLTTIFFAGKWHHDSLHGLSDGAL